MNQVNTARMLLSHNFEVSEDLLPALNLAEFTAIFADGLKDKSQLKVRQLNHPHWMVEILFPQDEFSPSQIGKLCAEALAKQRSEQKKNPQSSYEILILGGLKQTPPSSDSPDNLQPGEWGVDVVETLSVDDFLTKIKWDENTVGKKDTIFKIQLTN